MSTGAILYCASRLLACSRVFSCVYCLTLTSCRYHSYATALCSCVAQCGHCSTRHVLLCNSVQAKRGACRLFLRHLHAPSWKSHVQLSHSGVARICCEEGHSWKLGHGALKRWTSGPGAATARWLIVLWLCSTDRKSCEFDFADYTDLLQSELKMKLLEVRGARAPVPHSWRRHCFPATW